MWELAIIQTLNWNVKGKSFLICPVQYEGEGVIDGSEMIHCSLDKRVSISPVAGQSGAEGLWGH